MLFISRLIDKLYVRICVYRGLTIGKDVYCGRNVRFDSRACSLISIGDNSTLSNDVYILAHDASTKLHLGCTKVAKVSIGKRTFLGARSIVLPGVSIGDNVIIGAGSIVTSSIPDNVVAMGAPARIVSTLDNFMHKHAINISNGQVIKTFSDLKNNNTGDYFYIK